MCLFACCTCQLQILITVVYPSHPCLAAYCIAVVVVVAAVVVHAVDVNTVVQC